MPRQDERVSYLNQIVLESASGKREARISDLSPGGCYIDSIASVQEGEEVRFSLTERDGETMEFKGDIAYILNGLGFGVRFRDLTDEHKSFLNGIISSHR